MKRQMNQSQRTAVSSCAQVSCAISALLGCMFFVRPFSVLFAMLAISLLVLSLALLLSLLGLLPSISRTPGTVQA